MWVDTVCVAMLRDSCNSNSNPSQQQTLSARLINTNLVLFFCCCLQATYLPCFLLHGQTTRFAQNGKGETTRQFLVVQQLINKLSILYITAWLVGVVVKQHGRQGRQQLLVMSTEM